MEKKAKKSRLTDMPAWALALITFIVSLALRSSHNFLKLKESGIEIPAQIFYVILIASACFFICRAHPKSFWYTPVICNAQAFVPAILYSHFWTTPSEWIFWVSCFVVSVIGAVVGAKVGRPQMKAKKAKKSRIANIPAWALSVMAFFASMVLVFVLEIFIESSFYIVAQVVYIGLIAVACFFICKIHPKSFWYTPLICNTMPILPAIFYSEFWKVPSEWIFWVCYFVACVIAAVIGALVGRRKMNLAIND